jgi:PTH1 family peptidyl-tRNA hydrolase
MVPLVLGLGNPGETYRATRHNVGFRVVDELARRLGVVCDRFECGSRTARSVEPDVLLAQPQTYMNRSGYAARCLAELHGIEPGNVLVVYDEINLPLGKLRLRRGGSPAGHRGLESVVENLRTDQVPRLRLGVAGPDGPPSGEGLADFVLAPFAAAEEEEVQRMIERAADACQAWLTDGIDTAMNRFNG